MNVDKAPKISLALGIKKPPRPPPSFGVKRPHAALGDGDDDDEVPSFAEAVSHFDQREGGAISFTTSKVQGPLVIAPQSNRDWKEAGRRNANKRQRSGLPADANQEGLDERVKQIEAEFESRKAKFGLNVKERGDATGDDDVSKEEQREARERPIERQNGESSTQHQTEDQRAADALLGKQQESTLVLPAAANEEQAFQRDFTSAPNMSTLADYDRVPVEQFGAALLRGMGWRDGEGIGTQRGKKIEKSKLPERRPALLGIGAKEEAAVAQEMGVWGKAAKGRGGEIKIYNPVLLKDKKTGEKFTEEEWEKRKVAKEREKYELEFEAKEKERRRRSDRDDDRERDRRCDGRREKASENGDRAHRSERERRDDRSHRRNGSDSDEDSRRREKERRRRDHSRRDHDSSHSSRRRQEGYGDESRDRSHKDRYRR